MDNPLYNPFPEDSAEHQVFRYYWQRYCEAKRAAIHAFMAHHPLDFGEPRPTFDNAAAHATIVAVTQSQCAQAREDLIARQIIQPDAINPYKEYDQKVKMTAEQAASELAAMAMLGVNLGKKSEGF